MMNTFVATKDLQIGDRVDVLMNKDMGNGTVWCQ